MELPSSQDYFQYAGLDLASQSVYMSPVLLFANPDVSVILVSITAVFRNMDKGLSVLKLLSLSYSMIKNHQIWIKFVT